MKIKFKKRDLSTAAGFTMLAPAVPAYAAAPGDRFLIRYYGTMRLQRMLLIRKAIIFTLYLQFVRCLSESACFGPLATALVMPWASAQAEEAT